MLRALGPRKYAPLTAYLAARTGDAATLTLAEVEQIIGAPLPVSARQRSFWANRWEGSAQGRAWLAAGWRIAWTDLRRELPTVTFMRTPR